MVLRMDASASFVAVLLDDEDSSRDWVMEVPRLADSPPTRLCVPIVFAGAPALDVYDLDDVQEWPEQVVYQHVSVEPTTTDDDRPLGS